MCVEMRRERGRYHYGYLLVAYDGIKYEYLGMRSMISVTQHRMVIKTDLGR